MINLAALLVTASALVGQAQTAAAAEPLPANAQKQLEGFVGAWDITGSTRGKPLSGRYTTRWAPSGHCLLARYALTVDDRQHDGNILIGWDGATEEVVHVSFFTHGVHEYIRYKQIAPGKFEGKYTASVDGKRLKGDCHLTKDDVGGWSFTTVGLTADGEEMPELQVTLARVKSRDVAGMQSTREDFQEFARIHTGRWLSEITLIADWPGISKKQGDKVNGYRTVRPVADGHALQETENILELESTALYTWHPGSKQIKSHVVSTVGGTGETVFWKQDGQWHWKHSGSQPDGKSLTGRGRILVKDEGDTLILQGKVWLDGEPLAPYRDIYRRVRGGS